jgi:hypothetical protein
MRNCIEPVDRGFGHGIVSWPEVQVLRAIHGGEDTVLLIEDAGQAPGKISARGEKTRLLHFGYAGAALERLFPGSSPRMDLDPPLDEPGLPSPPAVKEAKDAEPEEKEASAESPDEPPPPTKKGKAAPSAQ